MLSAVVLAQSEDVPLVADDVTPSEALQSVAVFATAILIAVVVRRTLRRTNTVLVPNRKVLESPIINDTRTPYRRSELTIGVAYDTDLEQAQQVVDG